jgi:hypothetical protein
MAIRFTNNAATTLSSGINASVTSIPLTDGSDFPALDVTNDHAYITIEDSNNTEIVKATARSGNTLTVVRAQDGTSANSFASGEKVELRVTAISLIELGLENNVDGGTATSIYTGIPDINGGSA